jgi:glutamine amidotransferase
MCELLAMSSRKPTAIKYSLIEFSRNGSKLRHNQDGWGIAFARDRDAFLVKEPRPAKDSAWVRFIAEQPIKTTAVIAHVRYATRGLHSMENTHPFRRALGRRAHLFAHNGTLEGIEQAVDEATLRYRPIGETDSELAFCMLLSRLAPHYHNDEAPSLETRLDVFSGLCQEMKKLGSSNFLYYDGEVLFAHAHERIYEEAGELVGPKPPGLHIKRCWTGPSQKEVACPGLKVELPDRRTVLLASVPLDDQGWEELKEGTILALKDGEVLVCSEN